VANAITLRAADRAILVGASGTGKSTLAAYLLDAWRADYPKSRIMVVDTKPRWRGTIQADGSSPKKLYSRMAKGDEIKGAVTLSSMNDWTLAWDRDVNPSQTVVVQRIQQGWKDRSATQAATVSFALACIERYYATASIKRETLLYIDEGHDFFTPNGSGWARNWANIIGRFSTTSRAKPTNDDRTKLPRTLSDQLRKGR